MASTKEKTGKGSSAKPSGSKPSKGPSKSMVPAELFQLGTYKNSQGRTVRLVTAITFGVIIALSVWRLYDTLSTSSPGLKWGVPGALLFGGWWLCYRIINLPKFADFLIAVEAEMTKVSWPTQTELYRSSMVVILFIVSLAAILFLFDLFWQTIFKNVLGM